MLVQPRVQRVATYTRLHVFGIDLKPIDCLTCSLNYEAIKCINGKLQPKIRGVQKAAVTVRLRGLPYAIKNAKEISDAGWLIVLVLVLVHGFTNKKDTRI